MAINWTVIRNDYINGSYSYIDIADKYNVSYSSVEKKARREKWAELKMRQCEMINAKLRERTAEKIVEAESDVAAIMSRIRLKLVKQIEKAVNKMENVDTTELRKLVQCYKDMCEAGTGTEEERNGMLDSILEAVKGVGK